MADPDPGRVRPGDIVSVYTTVPDLAVGETLARGLVESRLVACVNLVPGGVSVYRWKGEVCRDAEVVCFLKTRRRSLSAVMNYIAKHHPYDLPAVYVMAADASKAVSSWVAEAVAPPALQRKTDPKVRRKPPGKG